jgi:hypothetical protein
MSGIEFIVSVVGGVAFLLAVVLAAVYVMLRLDIDPSRWIDRLFLWLDCRLYMMGLVKTDVYGRPIERGRNPKPW